MKILCRHETCASHYIYTGIGEGLRAIGHDFQFWYAEQTPAIPTFQRYKPDLFIGQGYNLDRATIKCINMLNDMVVLLKVGVWGPEIDTKQHGVLMASDEEREKVDSINNKSRVIVFNYYHPNRMEYTTGQWLNIVPRMYGLCHAADIKNFYPVRPSNEFQTDFMFLGGYWAEKARNLDRFIIPLCYPIGKYNIKIFGNQPWPVPQFLGFLDDSLTRKSICSATICPNIHEPHSNVYGFDINLRVFNLLASKAFCISDYVATLAEDIFTDNQLLMVKTPNEFFESCDYYLKNPEKRIEWINKGYNFVMKNHTYVHRAREIIALCQK